jgi:negative modulator of initiation of replication
MKTIEIDDQLYDYLLHSAVRIGENASEILERLLKIPKPFVEHSAGVQPSQNELAQCLSDPHFLSKTTALDKWLHILSFIYQRDPDAFKQVLRARAPLSGRSRKYFAQESQELQDSGKSVYPKKIPDSPYWVVTNNDTRKKRRILNGVLKLLGYGDSAITQALSALS